MEKRCYTEYTYETRWCFNNYIKKYSNSKPKQQTNKKKPNLDNFLILDL